MFAVLAVIIVQLISQPTPGLTGKPTSYSMLSKSLASDVKSWLSTLDNAVVVYSGFDINVPCLEDENNDNSKQTVSGNKSYVWYDNDNKTCCYPKCALEFISQTSRSRCRVSNAKVDDGVRLTVLNNGALRISSAQASDTGRYTCRPPQRQQRQQLHHVVVVFTPTVSVDYQFVFRVPMCDEMRMSQKADLYKDKAELENSERSDEENIELVVSNYSCSSAVDMRGFDSAYHHFTLVVSARLNTVASRLELYKLLLHAADSRQCDVKCQLKTIVTKILNESHPVIDKWKEEELEDKIYGEQRMFYGEMKFPEFMFEPSQLTYGVTLYCDTAGVATERGYTVLHRAVCVPCLPGTFFHPDTGNCTRCPLNTYQDQLAARSCTRCHRNHYTPHRGSNSSEQCIYHMFSVLARRVPMHLIVVAALVLLFCVSNCLYALIVNRRKTATGVSTQLTTVRALTPRQQQQQPGQNGRRDQRGDEKREQRPLLTTAAQEQRRQQPQQQLHP